MASILAIGLLGAACGSSSSGGGGGSDATEDVADDQGGDDTTMPDEGDVAADAADDSGPDVVETSDTSDAADSAEVSEPDPALVAACLPDCEKVVEGCPSAGVLDATTCAEDCARKAEEDLGWLASYACWVDACDTETCFPDGAPLPEVAECTGGCTVLETCSLFDMIEMNADEQAYCVQKCTGGAAANPALVDVASCIEAVSTDDCTAAESAVTDCLMTSNDLCLGLCDDIYDQGGPDDDFFCGPDTEVAGVWPDTEACMTACTAVEADASVAWSLCVRFADCADPATCADLPAEPYPNCPEACEALYDKCGEVSDGLSSPAFCSGACTAFVHLFGQEEANPDAATCIGAWDSCPAEPGEDFVACLMSPAPECVDMCGSLAACIPGDSTFDAEVCPLQCTMQWGMMGDAYGDVITCVEDAGDDCQAVFACIPRDPVEQSICEPYCQSLGTCGAIPDKCVDDCAAAIEGDPAQLARYSCELMKGCTEGPATCSTVATEDVPAECTAECTEGHACDEVTDTGCERICQAALTALSLSPANDAECIATELAPECNFGTLSQCLPL